MRAAANEKPPNERDRPIRALCAGVAAGAATAGAAAAAQLPKGLGSLVMQTFALRGLPVYVPLTVPSVSVAVDCPGKRGSPFTLP